MKIPGLIMSIVTHSGKFHADEALACFMLKQLPEYKDHSIVRTRDPAKIALGDIVVDVGGTYDHENNRFDHHQRSFDLTMKDLRGDEFSAIKLSSAGLVYHHFGEKILSSILDSMKVSEPDRIPIDLLFQKVYTSLIREIDAIDNGVPICEGKPAYTIESGISAQVGRANPNWNQPQDDDLMDEIFNMKAVPLIGSELLDRVNYYATVWYPARDTVRKVLKTQTGPILDFSLDEGGSSLPWKSHLFDLEKEMEIEGRAKFVVYQDTNGSWRAQAIPVNADEPFSKRAPLLPAFMGLRDEELSTACGIDGCIFVHATGFIGGNVTKEGALEMANKSLIQLG